MKTTPEFINDTIDINYIQRFRMLSNPFELPSMVSIMYNILRNDKGYDYDPAIIIILIKRLRMLGYKPKLEFIYLSLTQVEVDYLTGLSDEEIKVYSSNRWKVI